MASPATRAWGSYWRPATRSWRPRCCSRPCSRWTVSRRSRRRTSTPPAGAAPEIDGALAAMTGTDTDGTPVAIATIRLRDTGDESVQDAERRINQLAAGAEGPLRVSSVSPVVVEDEYRKATEEGMAPLIGLALLLIAALILVFLRTLSDLLLTLLAAPLPDLDHRGGGLARAGRAEADRPAELAHRAGADHRDQPHGGLCHPGRLALPRAASCRRSGGDRGADGTATRHHSP